MQLEESTFVLYAAKHYDNKFCHDITEFEEDVKRFQHVRKLLLRYKTIGDLRERLILNHLLIIYNCFGVNATHMLFMKLTEFHSELKSFIEYLNYMPEFVEYSGLRLHKSKIETDDTIKKRLEEL